MAEKDDLVFANRVQVITITEGSGPLDLRGALPAFQSFTEGGVTSGDSVRYVIEDGYEWEIGEGKYLEEAGKFWPMLKREPIETSLTGHALLNLSGGAVVFIDATKEDFAMAGIKQIKRTVLGPGSHQWGPKPENLMELRVVCVGGGGAGGDAAITTKDQVSVGQGGSGGGVVVRYYRPEELNGTESVEVGKGGEPASADDVTAKAKDAETKPGEFAQSGRGGNSSFKDMVAEGGWDGAAMGPYDDKTTRVSGGWGPGEGKNGELNLAGSPGGSGMILPGLVARSGGGGDCLGFGSGGPPLEIQGTWAKAKEGVKGYGYGAGGGGAANPQNINTVSPGGNGAPGVVIIDEILGY